MCQEGSDCWKESEEGTAGGGGRREEAGRRDDEATRRSVTGQLKDFRLFDPVADFSFAVFLGETTPVGLSGCSSTHKLFQ